MAIFSEKFEGSVFSNYKFACTSLQIQTGFGRLGSHYWGFESHGVIPDIGEKCCIVQ